METLLSGKKILITGGTSELGMAFVRKAVKSSAEVHFTYYQSSDKAKELEILGARGGKLDLSDFKAADVFLEKFKKENDSLDVLIHNAAATANGFIESMPEEDWDRVIAADLKAPFYLTQQLLPLLMQKKPSKVFMIVSRAGLSGLYGAANYAAAKGGMIAMMKSMAKELGRRQVLVNAVNPGFMLSGMTRGLSDKTIQRAADESSLKKLSDPDETAGFLVYLSSDLMKQVTGQVFHFESRPL